MQLTHKHRQFFNQVSEPHTPYLLVDLDVVEDRYRRLAKALPFADIYYAVKCNPAGQLINRLRKLGAGFEAASWPEVQACLAQGVRPEDVHFGNTIKSSAAIHLAHNSDIQSFCVDSPMELQKVALNAPGSHVSYRMAVSNQGAGFGLERKFGASVEQIVEMMISAQSLPVISSGVSFHVGSQQMDPGAWVSAIEEVARLLESLQHHGITLNLINLGGGFPAVSTPLLEGKNSLPPPPIEVFGEALSEAVKRLLPANLRFMIEPGRYLTADAGIIRSSVLLVSKRAGQGTSYACTGKLQRWVYLDAGRFNGLHDAGIVLFPIKTSRDSNRQRQATILAGPTCDSDDILYDEQAGVLLPEHLEEGDKVMFGGAGAYSSCFATKGFNGFPAIREYYI